MPIWEEDEKVLKSTDWMRYFINFFPLIFAALFWLIFHNRIGFKTIDVATLIFLGVVAVYALIRLPEQAIYNSSPKIVFANGFDTFAGTWEQAGNFAVIRRGIKAFGMHGQFKSPVYIVPMDSLTKKGESVVASVYCDMKTIEEVPLKCQEIIVQKGLKPPYYVGYADIEQYLLAIDDPQRVSGLTKPDVNYLITQINELTKQVSLQQKQLYEVAKVSEDSISDIVRMRERIGSQNKNPLRSALDWVKGKDEGERHE